MAVGQALAVRLGYSVGRLYKAPACGGEAASARAALGWESARLGWGCWSEAALGGLGCW